MDNGSIELAKSLMKEIMYDNGVVDRFHPEKYSRRWVNKIAPIAEYFFAKNPQVLENEDINLICCGFQEDVDAKYGKMDGWNELNKVLNDYFNNL